MNRILRAYFHAPPAPPAPIPYDRTIAFETNGIRKTDVLRTCAAAYALIRDEHGNAGHLRYLRTDLRAHVGKYFPKATTGAAVADREQLVARPYIQPDAVQFVAADEMNQSCLATAFKMKERLVSAHATAKLGVYAPCSLTEKEAAKVYGIAFAVRRLAANAGIHDPMIIRFLDEMLGYLRGENRILTRLEGAVHLNHVVLRQNDEIVPFEQGLVEKLADWGHASEF